MIFHSEFGIKLKIHYQEPQVRSYFEFWRVFYQNYSKFKKKKTDANGMQKLKYMRRKKLFQVILNTE